MTTTGSTLRQKVDAFVKALDAFGEPSAFVCIHLECEVDELREFGKVENRHHRYASPSVTIRRGDPSREQSITLFSKWHPRTETP